MFSFAADDFLANCLRDRALDLVDLDVEQVREHADIEDVDDHLAQARVFADGHHQLVEGHDVHVEVVALDVATRGSW